MILPLICFLSSFYLVSAQPGATTAVTALNASSYIGLWFQTYSNQASTDTFQKNGSCVTATYEVFSEENNTFTVFNYQTLDGPTGPPDIIRGFANIPNVSKIGEWVVVLNCTDDCFPAPYWILDLGPVNDEGLYDYAIVSDNIGLFLFVLARNVTEFNELYDEEVQITLTELGFVGPTRPIPTFQGPECIYYDDIVPADTTTASDSSEDSIWSNAIISVVVIFGFIGLGLVLGLTYWWGTRSSKKLITDQRESLLEVSSNKA